MNEKSKDPGSEVILSEVTVARSETVTESKDPYPRINPAARRKAMNTDRRLVGLSVLQSDF
jgi:hypothetical protein